MLSCKKKRNHQSLARKDLALSSGLPPIVTNPFSTTELAAKPCRYEVGKDTECGVDSVSEVRTPEGKKIQVCPMHLQANNSRFIALRAAAREGRG